MSQKNRDTYHDNVFNPSRACEYDIDVNESSHCIILQWAGGEIYYSGVFKSSQDVFKSPVGFRSSSPFLIRVYREKIKSPLATYLLSQEVNRGCAETIACSSAVIVSSRQVNEFSVRPGKSSIQVDISPVRVRLTSHQVIMSSHDNINARRAVPP